MSESLYFLAIVPPKKVQIEIMQLKTLIAERFNSKHALKSPPHITLHMPFKWKNKKLPQLHSAFEKINSTVQPFKVELFGFDYFEPRVIYVDVKKNKHLNSLQNRVVDICKKDLKLYNGNYKDRLFYPHVTIGFRDLRKPQFFDAKKYFDSHEFQASFKVKEVTLLKHDGSRWNISHLTAEKWNQI